MIEIGWRRFRVGAVYITERQLRIQRRTRSSSSRRRLLILNFVFWNSTVFSALSIFNVIFDPLNAVKIISFGLCFKRILKLKATLAFISAYARRLLSSFSILDKRAIQQLVQLSVSFLAFLFKFCFLIVDRQIVSLWCAYLFIVSMAWCMTSQRWIRWENKGVSQEKYIWNLNLHWLLIFFPGWCDYQLKDSAISISSTTRQHCYWCTNVGPPPVRSAFQFMCAPNVVFLMERLHFYPHWLTSIVPSKEGLCNWLPVKNGASVAHHFSSR